jgi:hypothetical protein
MEKTDFKTQKQSQNKTIFFKGLLAGLLLTPMLSLAQSFTASGSSSGGSSWSARVQGREGSRWTLQDWLAQKQRNNLMDQWLAMNSPSPFEFYLSGGYKSYDSQKDQLAKTAHSTESGYAAAYAQAVGLISEYENNTSENLNDVTGALSIRILGNSLQTTSLTLNVGQRTRQFIDNSQNETARNLFGEVTLQAYLTHYFGILGSYRQYSPYHNSDVGDVSGTLVEGGLFIDFKALRVYGKWSDDLQIDKASDGTKTEYKRRGIKSGITIFF